MSKVITKYAINCLYAVVCFAPLAWLQENPFLTRNIPHVTELSPVLSDPLLNYERMWVSPFSKLKGNICLINVILICLYWTLNNNLPSSHSLQSVSLSAPASFTQIFLTFIYEICLILVLTDVMGHSKRCTGLFTRSFVGGT